LVNRIDKGLNRDCVLAYISAQSAVVVSIAYDSSCTHPSFAVSHTGPGDILSIGVNFDGAEIGAQSGCWVTIIAQVAHLDTGLIHLAAEVAARAGGGTDMQQHIGIDSFIFGAFCHTLSSGIVSK